jgi:hypothetical protein
MYWRRHAENYFSTLLTQKPSKEARIEVHHADEGRASQGNIVSVGLLQQNP